MYKAVFFQSNESKYYCDNNLLFTVKRKRLFLGIRNICSAYSDSDLIYRFYSSEFTFLYWKLKILTQKLNKRIELKKNGNTYDLILDGKILSLKFTNNPFKRKIGKIFLNGNYICEIEKNEKNSNTYFNFTFSEETKLEYYALILFSMHSVGITDSV
ncbi:MAG: hypothetical protein DI548_05220 [Flavobacterium johnsoniae]|nr:MAG: hypothetical protein DI548_05220 [Flavobacterium johnsoniae]